MAKSKHNWAEIKTEYLNGNVKDASVFIRQKFGISEHKRLPSAMNTQIKGWHKDWTKVQKNIATKAIKKIEEKKSVDLAEALEDIHYFLKDYAKIARNTKGKNGLAKVDDVKHVWDMLRTENGLPTKITHSKIETVADPEDSVDTLLSDNE